jgi:hypothetical protein
VRYSLKKHGKKPKWKGGKVFTVAEKKHDWSAKKTIYLVTKTAAILPEASVIVYS